MVDKDVVVKEEPVETAEETGPMRLRNVKGTVISAKRNAIHFSVIHDGEKQVACMAPVTAYANGSRLLLDACSSDQEIGSLFPKELKVGLDLIRVKANQHGYPAPRNARTKLQYSWVVNTMWVRPQDSDDDDSALVTDESLREPVPEEMKASFEKHLELVHERWSQFPSSESAVDATETTTQIEQPGWFVSCIKKTNGGKALSHPDDATFKSRRGTVTELLPPHGGLAEVETDDCGKHLVFFHRARVFVDGKTQLSITADLNDHFDVLSSEVVVDYIENDGIFDEGDFVALLVRTGDDPDTSTSCIPRQLFDAAKSPPVSFFIARIVSFDESDSDGSVVGGIADILNHNAIGVKRGCRKFLCKDESVKRVRFHRRNMFHIGLPLINADLRYFFAINCLGLNIFHCSVKPIDGAIGKDGVKHEVSYGWKNNFSVQWAEIGQPIKAEDTLLFPRPTLCQTLKYLSVEGKTVRGFENIISGKCAPKHLDYCGNEDNGEYLHPLEQYVPARIIDLSRPQPVNVEPRAAQGAIVILEFGEHRGRRIRIDRKGLSMFGWKLENVDLNYALELNEVVWVKVEPFKKSVKALNAWMGWPLSKEDPTSDDKKDGATTRCVRGRDKLMKINNFLTCRGMTQEQFLKNLNDEHPPLPLAIPFRREENKGTVIKLVRGHGSGSASGIIKVDEGPLYGQLVSFQRQDTWVMGKNMGKADLTYMLGKQQKVTVEAQLINNMKEGKPKHDATLVFVSKARPSNKMTMTEAMPEVKHWLNARRLNWQNFMKLVTGGYPPVDPKIAQAHGSNMVDWADKTLSIMKANTDSVANRAAKELVTKMKAENAVNKETVMPVLRHGREAARIFDTALSVSGPNDPRLQTLVTNDSSAQMAFHVYKALSLALEVYKSKSANSDGTNALSFQNQGLNPEAFGSVLPPQNYATPEHVAQNHYVYGVTAPSGQTMAERIGTKRTAPQFQQQWNGKRKRI